MLTCYKAWQFFNLACQRAKWRANFSFWRVRVLKSVPVFQTFFLEGAKGNFNTLFLYKKFYIILDIIVIHMICICIVYKNCIIPHLYNSCHIKEKCAEFLFWFLYVTFNEGFIEFSPAKTTKQKKKVLVNIVIFLNCDLLEFETRDSYKILYCKYASFRFLRLCF